MKSGSVVERDAQSVVAFMLHLSRSISAPFHSNNGKSDSFFLQIAKIAHRSLTPDRLLCFNGGHEWGKSTESTADDAYREVRKL